MPKNTNGAIYKELIEQAERDGLVKRLNDETRMASLDTVLAQIPPNADVLIFAYGSLVYNPGFDFVAQERAFLCGYRRQFNLWLPMGRGTPENPGLVLGLEPSAGRCSGILFHIAHNQVQVQLTRLWDREMLTGIYNPQWVDVHTDKRVCRALTFVNNTSHERYAPNIHPRTVAKHMATAEGALGSAFEYLTNTLHHLNCAGIHDDYLNKILDMAHNLRSAPTKNDARSQGARISSNLEGTATERRGAGKKVRMHRG